MPAPKRHDARPPTHPGAILREDVLPELGLTQEALAEQLGVSRVTLSSLLHERRALTATLAVRIERELAVSAALLMNMQTSLDLWHARQLEAMVCAELTGGAELTAYSAEAAKAIEVAQMTSLRTLNATAQTTNAWTDEKETRNG